MRNAAGFFASVCLLLAASLCSAQAAAASASPREFVQEFYSWYSSKAVQNHASRAWDIAVRDRSAAFSSEILRALKADSVAQDKSTGDIVGLDFDPFLYSQDPAQRYEVSKVTAKGTGWLVEVSGVRAGKKSGKAGVVAEVSPANGGWQFVNFHYEEGQDLMTVLKLLREDRQKDSK
ncbi:MAG: hypothetical protein ABSH47_14670 [Bryobacteraceae bacterium]|jgi:hypothetical protein